MAGYYEQRLVRGVDNDLYAKSIVLEQDGVKVALVSCDLVEMPRLISDEARRLIQKSTGIEPGHVMISATHDHTGPVLPSGNAAELARHWDLALARAYAWYLAVECVGSQLGAAAMGKARDQWGDASMFAVGLTAVLLVLAIRFALQFLMPIRVSPPRPQSINDRHDYQPAYNESATP